MPPFTLAGSSRRPFVSLIIATMMIDRAAAGNRGAQGWRQGPADWPAHTWKGSGWRDGWHAPMRIPQPPIRIHWRKQFYLLQMFADATHALNKHRNARAQALSFAQVCFASSRSSERPSAPTTRVPRRGSPPSGPRTLGRASWRRDLSPARSKARWSAWGSPHPRQTRVDTTCGIPRLVRQHAAYAAWALRGMGSRLASYRCIELGQPAARIGSS